MRRISDLDSYRLFFVDFHVGSKKTRKIRTSIWIAHTWYDAKEVARAIYGNNLLRVVAGPQRAIATVLPRVHLIAYNAHEWEVLR